MSQYLWDYNEDELAKTEKGRIFILERMITYGPGKRKKIPLEDVRKYWDKLHIPSRSKRLLSMLLWENQQSLHHNNSKS